MASIRLDRLTKDFNGLLAVDDVDIEIADGTFVALLGPSGCGKTTTMNMISGLETPTSGEIYFDERPMSKVAPGKRSVGFVFQNYAIFTHMSVYQNLAFGLRVRKPKPPKSEIETEVKRVADIVGVGGMLDRTASRLSVNDMQKVALGRSMIVNPSIFLLDEPFSNLDAAFRAYMRAELKHIQHEIGQTMVYVTHDQVEAMGMADKIAVMNLGVLQQFAPPLELYNKPANKFVAGFVGSTRINFLPAQKVSTIEAPAARDGGSVTLAIRPEYVQLVPPGSADAVLGAKVDLVEPLGAVDVIHLSWERHDLRAIGRPGARPRIGDSVGLVFPREHILFFDDATEKAINGSNPS
jgi:multiple sugar transport system ATP-binding protein